MPEPRNATRHPENRQGRLAEEHIMEEWVVAESMTDEEMESEGMDAGALSGKWEEVADDMALIPENNVRVVTENGVTRVEVSTVMMDCLRGC